MAEKKSRIFYYDFLRALAILFVILIHTSPFYNLGSVQLTSDFIISNAVYDIAKMGVPLFFMLSGCLLLNREYELGAFLKKRFTRILYPFLFWIIIIMAGVYYLDGTSHLLDMFLGRGQFTWFIWVLMGCYLFIPIFNTFIKRYGIKAAEYYLIFWIITCIFTDFSLPTCIDLSLFTGWFGIIVVGYFIDNYEFKMDNSKVCILGFLIFAITLIINLYLNYMNYLVGFQSNSMSIVSVVMAAGLFLFIKYLGEYNSLKKNLVGKFIASVGVCSYGMYFTHIIVVRPFLVFFNQQSFLVAGIVFIVVLLVSWLVVYIFSKIPVIKRFSGV